MKKKIVLHIISTDYLIRSHIVFKDTASVKFIYGLEDSYDIQKYIHIASCILNLYNKGMIFQINLNKIKKISPDIIITSNLNSIIDHPEYKEYCFYNNIPFCVFHHGIMNQDLIDYLSNKKAFNWLGYDKYFLLPKEIHIFKNFLDKLPGKLIEISGTTQLDYLNLINLESEKDRIYGNISSKTGILHTSAQKQSLSISKKSILYIQCHDFFENETEIRDFESIISFLTSYTQKNNIHLFVKLKQDRNIPEIILQKYRNHENITFLEYKNKNIIFAYNFFFADVIIAENYGSSFIEALYRTPHVILCSLSGKGDRIGITKYDRLFYATSEKKLELFLEIILRASYFPDSEYNIQRNSFLKEYIGNYSNFLPAYKQITNELEKLG